MVGSSLSYSPQMTLCIRFKRTGKRNEIFLGTKFGVTVDETGYRSRGDPEFIKKSFAESLKRLNVDYVDLLYSHR